MSKSMLTPPEREQYVAGALAKAVGKAVKPKRKYRTREQIDADNAKILEQKKAKKEAREKEKEEAKLKQEKSRGTWRFEGNFFDNAGRKEYLLKKEEPEGTGDFRAAYRYAWRNKKDTFMHKGDKYSTDLNMGNTQKSLLISPEREEYVVGSIVKAGKKIYDKASRKARSELDKAQGITSESPGRTAESRGAVIGKDRTKAFKNTEQVVGGVKASAVVIPATAIATAWLSKDNKGKPPSEFEKAFSKAHNAGEETFTFKGKVYSTEVRKGKADGGRTYDPVQGYKEMYMNLERSLENAETEEQRKTIEKNFLKDTGNVPGTTVRDAMMELEEEGFFNREAKAKGGLPDLTGDGEITQADVLKGRGVFNEGSLITKKEKRQAIEQAATDIFSKYSPDDMPVSIGFLPPVRRAVAELKDGENIEDIKKSMTESLMFEYFPEEYKAQEQQEIKAAAKKFPTKRGDDRKNKAEGSLMMPPEGMPVDTYPNIPEDEMDEALASQLPDDEMEEDYISYVMDESLDDDEQDYLAGVLQNDPRLSDILDKVITVASEFSGAGEVEGPGTGVSDSIPARLSDGEFVFTRKATDQIGADKLQTMMDDAERAYDGGYQMKAIGGYMLDKPNQETTPMSKTEEEIRKLMMGANKMPSLQ